MVIAFNISWLNNSDIHKSRMIINLIVQLAEQQPEQKFLLITEKLNQLRKPFPKNINILDVAPGSKNKILQKLWRKVRLPRILKKANASVLVSFDLDFSISAHVPQVNILFEITKQVKKLNKKKNRVVVISELIKSELINKFKFSPDQIDFIAPWPSANFIPGSTEKSLLVKSTWSDEKEFFFCSNYISQEPQFVFLLKAFSHFKKRQQSGFKLLLLTKPGSSFVKQLDTYKYRADVKLIESNNELDLVSLTNSAYAVLHPFVNKVSNCLVLESMASAIPVIISNKNTLLKFSEKDVLITEEDSTKELGEKMIRLYTDEKLRSQLINRGKKIVADYSIQRSAHELWLAIEKAVQ